MSDHASQPNQTATLVAGTSLEAFFHQVLSDAVEHQQVRAGDVTIRYLVMLLTHFARSENLFDYTEEGLRLRPLAQMYEQALQSASARERCLTMRRMGDVALFVSGMFSGFVTRRRALVGVDYYIAMGERAYGSLLQRGCCDPGSEALQDVFGQLSNGFGGYVRVLAEVGEIGVRGSRDELRRLLDAAGRPGREARAAWRH